MFVCKYACYVCVVWVLCALWMFCKSCNVWMYVCLLFMEVRMYVVNGCIDVVYVLYVMYVAYVYYVSGYVR